MQKTTKLVVFLTICIFSITTVFAETYDAIGTRRLRVSTCVGVGGMWGEHWNTGSYKVATQISNNKFVLSLYSRDDEAWNYYCKITLKDFVIPDRKTNKAQQKSEKWFHYDCDIEFSYSVEYPSVEECFANYGGFVVNSKNTEAKKRTVKGHVKIRLKWTWL